MMKLSDCITQPTVGSAVTTSRTNYDSATTDDRPSTNLKTPSSQRDALWYLKEIRAYSIGLILFGFLAPTGVLLLQNIYPQLRDAYSPPQKFEYKVVSFDDSLVTYDLNDLGELGWNVVSSRRAIVPDDDEARYEFVLQREK